MPGKRHALSTKLDGNVAFWSSYPGLNPRVANLLFRLKSWMKSTLLEKRLNHQSSWHLLVDNKTWIDDVRRLSVKVSKSQRGYLRLWNSWYLTQITFVLSTQTGVAIILQINLQIQISIHFILFFSRSNPSKVIMP